MNAPASWFQGIPKSWEITRAKFLFNREQRPIRDEDEIVTAFRDGEVTLRVKRRIDGFTNSLKEIGYQGIRKGDLVVHAMDAFAGAIGVSDSEGKATPVYSVCTPRRSDVRVPYYARLLRHMALSGFVESLSKGVRERSTEFRWAELAEVYLPVPLADEQERIANFLDEKTARIDALIAEKERLEIAVQEYEQAEISRLLTEGLDDKPMLKTGREFLPEAPAGWRVAVFKRALQGMNQGWSPQCENRQADVNEWGVVKVGCVNGTTFDASENKALPAELEPDLTCVLRKGDVLVSRANTKELVGMAALVEHDYPNLLLCDKLYRLQLRDDWVLREYSILLLRSQASRRQIELGASGASSSMQNISQDVIRELLVAFPSLDEQRSIVAKSKQIRKACNELVHHTKNHIDRLREYRSSLISAAVTGQLDSSLQEPEPALAA